MLVQVRVPHRLRAFVAVCVVTAATLMSVSANAKDKKNEQSISGTSSNNYAASSLNNNMTMDQLKAMPRDVAPLPVTLKGYNVKFLAGKKRVYVPSYALMITRDGEASAYSGGGMFSDAQRRSTIRTTMSGVSDELSVKLASEAHADLIERLRAAGYEVVTAQPVGVPAPIGATMQSTTKQTVYAPASMSLYPGMPWTAKGFLPNTTAFNKVVGRGNTNGDDLFVILPGLGIDYERMQSSGSHMFGTSADVGAKLRFHVMEGSGAYLVLHAGSPYNAAWPVNYLVDKNLGTDEPFAVLAQTGDKSDSKALHVGLALMGINSRYNQKKIYEASADPERFAALTRAVFRGVNTALVTELQTAAAK